MEGKEIAMNEERVIAGDKLSTYDMIKIFDVSPLTLKNWRENGGLPYFRLGRCSPNNESKVVYDPVEVEQWATQNGKPMKVSPTKYTFQDNSK